VCLSSLGPAPASYRGAHVCQALFDRAYFARIYGLGALWTFTECPLVGLEADEMLTDRCSPSLCELIRIIGVPKRSCSSRNTRSARRVCSGLWLC
jgi:hypothetical protein